MSEHVVHLDTAFAAVFCFLASLLFLCRAIGRKRAALVAALKTAIPLIYFTWFDRFRLVDDVTYSAKGRELLARGDDPFTLLLDPVQRMGLFHLAGGVHIGFNWLNACAQWIFGAHYQSAVFVNVAMSALAAAGLARLLRLAGAKRGYRVGVVVFFCLHWEVLTWTSLFNLKGAWVLAGGLWLLVGAVEFQSTLKLRWLLLCLVLAAGLATLRIYVPVLALLAFGVWGTLGVRGWRRPLFAASALGAAVVLLPAMAALGASFSEMPVGSVRFLLTPRPWGTEHSYRFLQPAALLNWGALPFLALGVFDLLRRSSLARLMCIYGAVLILFYGAYAELQGPRARLGLAGCFAWAQFHGFYVLFEQLRRTSAGPFGSRLEPAPTYPAASSTYRSS